MNRACEGEVDREEYTFSVLEKTCGHFSNNQHKSVWEK